MQISKISFGKIFSTNEVAKIVSGEKESSVEFLSEISGIKKHELLSRYNSDVLTASSIYCARKISETHPEFQTLKEIGAKIKELFQSLYNGNKDTDINALKKLSTERITERKKVCDKIGNTIDIEPFNIPFLYK